MMLRDVTLCCADTQHPNLAVRAMRHCMRQVTFARAVLFTNPALLTVPADGIIIVPTQLRSRDEYSVFMLRGMLNHVHTSHALIVQWDGWILNPSCWTDEFLRYDYVGAPSLDYDYLPVPLPADHEKFRMGNGGFCLRSRRLLQALQVPDMAAFHPEDVCICHHHRQRLETEFGLQFAPLHVGARFAYERPHANHPTFGFHGIFNFHHALPRTELMPWLHALPDALRCGNDTRKLINELLNRQWLAEAAVLIEARKRAGMRDLRTWRLRGRLTAARIRESLSA